MIIRKGFLFDIKKHLDQNGVRFEHVNTSGHATKLFQPTQEAVRLINGIRQQLTTWQQK